MNIKALASRDTQILQDVLEQMHSLILLHMNDDEQRTKQMLVHLSYFIFKPPQIQTTVLRDADLKKALLHIATELKTSSSSSKSSSLSDQISQFHISLQNLVGFQK